MAIDRYDSDSSTETVLTGESVTVTAESQRAELLQVFVDDGSGGDPSSYDLTVEVYSPEADAWFVSQELSSSGNQSPDLARDVKESLTGSEVRLTLTAGADATYRLVIETYIVQ